MTGLTARARSKSGLSCCPPSSSNALTFRIPNTPHNGNKCRIVSKALSPRSRLGDQISEDWPRREPSPSRRRHGDDGWLLLPGFRGHLPLCLGLIGTRPRQGPVYGQLAPSAGLPTCIRAPPASHLSCGRPPTPPNRSRRARKHKILGQARVSTDGLSGMRSHGLELIEENRLLGLTHTLFRMKCINTLIRIN